MCNNSLSKRNVFYSLIGLSILATYIFYSNIGFWELDENTKPVQTIILDINLQEFNTKKTTTTTTTKPTPSTKIKSNDKSKDQQLYKCCKRLNSTLRTNVYFLKTHKTGGSTVQNIILRFALNYSLDVMNIFYATYYLPLSDFSIYPHVRTPNNKYHILAHHVRYSSQLTSYQYPNTSMVTIMRHPVTLFQSLYDYFRFNDSTGMPLKQFLNSSTKPPVIYSTTNWMAYRGYNQMSYDLGFNLEANVDNQTAIDEFIEKIDRNFDLVMITERMEESLVLFANLMAWPLEYMAHLKINVRPTGTPEYKLTSREKNTIMELNHVDAQLYHHFLHKFLKCAKQYGNDKLKRDVNRLRILNERFKKRCVAQEHVGGLMDGYLKAIEYVPRNSSDLECKYATSLELPLENMVVDEQYKRLLKQHASSTIKPNY